MNAVLGYFKTLQVRSRQLKKTYRRGLGVWILSAVEHWVQPVIRSRLAAVLVSFAGEDVAEFGLWQPFMLVGNSFLNINLVFYWATLSKGKVLILFSFKLSWVVSLNMPKLKRNLLLRNCIVLRDAFKWLNYYLLYLSLRLCLLVKKFCVLIETLVIVKRCLVRMCVGVFWWAEGLLLETDCGVKLRRLEDKILEARACLLSFNNICCWDFRRVEWLAREHTTLMFSEQNWLLFY